MKRAILTSLIFFTSFSFLLAQTGSIHGTVSDQITNDKIPFAAVTVISENETFQNGGISNGEGSFTIDKLKPGNYKLLVSFMGYKTDTISELRAGRPIRKIGRASCREKV